MSTLRQALAKATGYRRKQLMRKWWARTIGAKGSTPKRVLPDWVPAYEWEYKGGKYYQWKWYPSKFIIKKDCNETSFRTYTSYSNIIEQFKADYIKEDFHYSNYAPELKATIIVLKSKDYDKYPKEFLGNKFVYSNYEESIHYCFDKYVENVHWHNSTFTPCRNVDRHYAAWSEFHKTHFKGTEHRPRWVSHVYWHEYWPYPCRGAYKHVGKIAGLLSGTYMAIPEIGEKKLFSSFAEAENWLTKDYPESKP